MKINIILTSVIIHHVVGLDSDWKHHSLYLSEKRPDAKCVYPNDILDIADENTYANSSIADSKAQKDGFQVTWEIPKITSETKVGLSPMVCLTNSALDFNNETDLEITINGTINNQSQDAYETVLGNISVSTDTCEVDQFFLTSKLTWKRYCSYFITSNDAKSSIINTVNEDIESYYLCQISPYTDYKITINYIINNDTKATYNCTFRSLPKAPPKPRNLTVEPDFFNDERKVGFNISWYKPDSVQGVLAHFILMIEKRNRREYVVNTLHNASQICDGNFCKIEYKLKVLEPDQDYSFRVAGLQHEFEASKIWPYFRQMLNFETKKIRTNQTIPKFVENKDIISSMPISLAESPCCAIKVHINTGLLDHYSGNISKVQLIVAPVGKLSDLKRGLLPAPNKNSDEQATDVANASDKTTYIKNLQSSTHYQVKLRYSNNVGYVDTPSFEYVTAAPTTVEMVYLIAVLLVTFFVIYSTTTYAQRLNKVPYFLLPDTPLHPEQLSDPSLHRPVQLIDLEATVQELHTAQCIKVKSEFAAIREFKPKNRDVTIAKRYSEKNRYNDILPYEHSRVKLQRLSGVADSSYINANYIHSYKERFTFIATQGPKEETINDFWRMIWEKDVHIIVMLTRCVENHKVKVDRYWIRNQRKKYDRLSVEHVRTDHSNPDKGYVIREFNLTNGVICRTVHQYHYTVWPDMNCPDDPRQLINLAEVVINHRDSFTMKHHVVVHCSAGVGRTGAFIALCNLIEEINDPVKNYVDVFYAVIQARYNRVNMVQTEIQYSFLYKCILEYYKSLQNTNEETLNHELPRNVKLVDYCTSDKEQSDDNDKVPDAIQDFLLDNCSSDKEKKDDNVEIQVDVHQDALPDGESHNHTLPSDVKSKDYCIIDKQMTDDDDNVLVNIHQDVLPGDNDRTNT